MKISVINGPNLNMLGVREPDIYGKTDYTTLCKNLEEYGKSIGVEIECYQSNHEGDLVDAIQRGFGAVDAIVINPGAYTHTSIAILDAVKAVGIPTVEVHISDINSREDFRKVSFVSMGCIKTISGHGTQGYNEAITFLKEYIEENQ